MSDISDEQHQAEVLDDDEIDILDYPPDRTLGVDDLLDDDVPAAGEYAPDVLRHRLAREEPGVGGAVLTGSAVAAHGTGTRAAEEADGIVLDDDKPSRW